MHARLSILSRFHAQTDSLDTELEQLASAGVTRAGLSALRVREAGLESGSAAVARSGIAVTHIGLGFMRSLLPLDRPEQIARAQDDLRFAIDAAVAVGAPVVYGPTGGAPAYEWEEAAATFVANIEPVVAYARERDIALLIEPTIPLLADLSIVTTLSDTVDLAERAGIGTCIDLYHCWTERKLREAILRALPTAGLVQISDWLPGDRHLFRAIPGDGAIPLYRLLGWILEAGYDGFVDLEITAQPGIAPSTTIARAVAAGSELLERLGA